MANSIAPIPVAWPSRLVRPRRTPARAPMAVSSALLGPGVPATTAANVTNAITRAGSAMTATHRSVTLAYAPSLGDRANAGLERWCGPHEVRPEALARLIKCDGCGNHRERTCCGEWDNPAAGEQG